MKTIFRVSFMVAIVLCLTVLFCCKKDEITIYLPTVKVLTIKDITATTATADVEVVSDGGAVVTVRGVCWSSSNSYPCTSDSRTKNGSGLGIFTSSITGLEPGTTYFVRSYAVNAIGTAYCSMTKFKTLTETESPTETESSNETESPFIRTSAYSYLTDTSFYSGGNVTNDGGSLITQRGICWKTSPAPTISDFKTTDGTGTGMFLSSVTGLTPGTTYYARAYATNSAGTTYGNEIIVRTTLTLPPWPPGEIIFNQNLTYGTLSDIDGNTYKTIKIGSQTWMAENLRTTKYKDGTEIPLVTDGISWGKLATPGYCWYDNDATSYKFTCGALYNWFTVNTGKLCPVGWHVPDIPEWRILTDFLGGEYVAGGKLKEAGLTHWKSPNIGATNLSGFTALPGGIRYGGEDMPFFNLGNIGCFMWSTTELFYDDIVYVVIPFVQYNLNYCSTDWAVKQMGCSVRCVKD